MADTETPTPKPTAPAKVDAILCPLYKPEPRPGEDMLSAIKREFAPVIGAPVVYSRHYGANQRFVTASPGDTADFPIGHPKARESRYVWTDRGDGVLYGSKKADA